MIETIRQILSHDCGPFWQFVKYGVIGVLSTLVQTGVFYLLSATVLKCLTPTDWAVRMLGLPSVDAAESNERRAFRFALATAVGFTVANVFCWLMNRWFVFTPGEYVWYFELALFFGAAALATLIAIAVSSFLIRRIGLMTTIAVGMEVVMSFAVNFVIRKYVIFKG